MSTGVLSYSNGRFVEEIEWKDKLRSYESRQDDNPTKKKQHLTKCNRSWSCKKTADVASWVTPKYEGKRCHRSLNSTVVVVVVVLWFNVPVNSYGYVETVS